MCFDVQFKKSNEVSRKYLVDFDTNCVSRFSLFMSELFGFINLRHFSKIEEVQCNLQLFFWIKDFSREYKQTKNNVNPL